MKPIKTIIEEKVLSFTLVKEHRMVVKYFTKAVFFSIYHIRGFIETSLNILVHKNEQ
jgi:hypothetical protein